MGRRLSPAEQEAHFWDRVAIGADDECWEWQGPRMKGGYGRLYWEGRSGVLAHRVAYQLTKGEIPEGTELDHVRARGCTSTACCNPAHLEAVLHKVNCERGDAGQYLAEKTKCPRGHAYAGDNLVLRNGRRQCRVCWTEQKRAAAQRHHERNRTERNRRARERGRERRALRKLVEAMG